MSYSQNIAIGEFDAVPTSQAYNSSRSEPIYSQPNNSGITHYYPETIEYRDNITASQEYDDSISSNEENICYSPVPVATQYVYDLSFSNRQDIQQRGTSPPPRIGNFSIGEVHGTSIVGSSISVVSNQDGTISQNHALLSQFQNTAITDDVSDCAESVKQEILDSTLPLSEDNRYLIAENIGNDYRKMTRLLPGRQFKLENIEADHHIRGQEEIIYKILEKWHQEAPTLSTVGNIAKVLQKMKKIHLANCLSLEDVPLDD